MQCDHEMRDGLCELDHGHRGRHSTVAFYCDGHAGMVRGYPHAEDQDISLCWLCCTVTGPQEARDREARAQDREMAQ